MLGYVNMGDMNSSVYDPIGGARQVAFANELETAMQIAECLYRGTDLSVKFADEIAAAPYSGNAWAWIQARTQAGDYSGIHVFDWLPFTADGHDYQAQIAGINTCTGYGDIPTGNHIDFITKELWHVKRAMNLVERNTGAVLPDGTTEYCEWLIADLKHYLNSESGYTMTDETAHTMEIVDYTNSGVYRLLPSELKSVILEKRVNLLGRWSSFSDATEPNYVGWENIGKLWLPTEYELMGIDSIRSTNTRTLRAYIAQYPIFAGNAGSRLKKLGADAGKWWTMSATRNYKNWTGVDSDAAPNYFAANAADVGFPICFRVG